MKKIYRKPTATCIDIINTYTLCIVSDKVRDDGLDEMGGYGGVDEDGNKDPDIKFREGVGPFSVGMFDGWTDGLW